MSVVVVGLEHRRTPLDVLERVTVGEAELPKALAAVRGLANVEEGAVLSTCLRTEVYAVVDRFHDAVDEVQELLASWAGVGTEDLAEHVDVRFDDEVASHLFAVAAGLESAVVGESEILGQVRRAWQRAEEEKVSGPVLGALFRHAVVTGKRVRSQTAIARGTTSFAHGAVELAAAERPGGLAAARVAVAGAGVMGQGILRALAALGPAGPAEVVAASRRKASLAEAPAALRPRLEVIELAELGGALGAVDVLFTALDVDRPVIGPEQLARRRRPLLVVDLGVPRNVAPETRHLGGVTVLDMESLKASVNRAVHGREEELGQATAIVADEVHRYRRARQARGAAPVVAALRQRLEDLRVGELARHKGALSGPEGASFDQVDAITKAVLHKLVHEPTVVVKEAAGTSRGERLVEALRVLFDL